ncbi:hypothetical protein DFQ28_002594 [Apophysomyces sp. BC1034]|nr:hypothetical protein DFQ30_002901 [Apophysomyces sp. BC1015]KAG0179463.1 hypothetical protein DFQ29_002082 [Apophysomyces sp. BC1021]KAG0190047.1 hypothetical protein DFQ28_002594 [Apophysomyces sp. BC1034]
MAHSTDFIELHKDCPEEQDSLLRVDTLPGKGRAYIATQPIQAGTLVHISKPVAVVVAQEWIPETCSWCFTFKYPKRMRIRAITEEEAKNSKQPKDMMFCSEECRQCWRNYGYEGEWELLVRVTHELDQEHKKRLEINEEEPVKLDISEDEWVDLQDNEILARWVDEVWEKQLPHTSPRNLDKAERTMCRVVAHALARKQFEHVFKKSVPGFDDLLMVQNNELAHFRSCCQGDKIQRGYVPPGVVQVMEIYNFFAAALEKTGLEFTHQTFRDVYFREMSNSFGMWEMPKRAGDGVTDDLELLGWGIFASAVFFNHSCDANIDKVRQERNIAFIANRDIAEGEEACISYGCVTDGLTERRQRLLENYYFMCNCTRCKQEEQSLA